MRKFFIVLLLAIMVAINYELTFASHEIPSFIPLPIYLILAAVSLIIFVGLWIDYRLRHPIQSIEWLFIVMIMYSMLAGVWSQHDILLSELNTSLAQTTSIFTLPTMTILQGIFYGMSVGMMFYTLYFFTNTLRSAKFIYYLALAIVLGFVMAEIIYSLVFEWDEYVYVFYHFNDGARMSITSFTSNTNIYAFHLSLGVYGVGSLYMTEKKHRWIYPLLAMIFSILIGFTVSKTVILAMVIYVVIYGLLMVYRLLMSRPILLNVVMAGLIVLVVMGYQFISMINHPFIERIQSLVMVTAVESFQSRIDIWNDAITLFQRHNTVFGYGFGLSNVYFGVATAIGSTNETGRVLYEIVNDRFHSGFLEMLLSFGLVGTYLLVIAHWAYIKTLVQLTKRYAITIPIWALIISFIAQMMFEDRLLFRPDLSGILILVLLILPIAKPNEYNRRHEVNN